MKANCSSTIYRATSATASTKNSASLAVSGNWGVTNLHTGFAGTRVARTILQQLCESEFLPQESVLTQPDRPKGRGRSLQANPQGRGANKYLYFNPEPAHGRIDCAIGRHLTRCIDPSPLTGLILPQQCSNFLAWVASMFTSLYFPVGAARHLSNAQSWPAMSKPACIMQMDEGLDTGPVRSNRCTDCTRGFAQSLEQLLADQGAQLLINTLLNCLLRLSLTGRRACYQKLTAADRQVDWRRSAGRWTLKYAPKRPHASPLQCGGGYANSSNPGSNP